MTPQGAKSWRMAYRLEGKPKTMTFGPYPDVSLARARLKRDEVKALLRDGADPMAPRRKQGVTLNEAVAQYWQGRKDLSAAYVTHATRAIEQHLSPTLGTQPGQRVRTPGRAPWGQADQRERGVGAAGAQFDAVARHQDQRLALGQHEKWVGLAVLGVGLGVPKFGEPPLHRAIPPAWRECRA